MSILQSIKPQYCALIAYGIKCPVPVPKSNKRYEVRKNMPKLPTPFKSYVYCTKSDGDGCYPSDFYHWLGKVPFEYVCDHIKVIQALPDRNIYDISADDLKKTHLSQKELWEYGNGKPLYLWHISDLKIYDKPKELSEFVKCNMPSFDELSENEILCNYCLMTDYGERKSFGFTAGDYYDCGGEECKEAYENYLDANKYLTRPPQSWCYVEEVTE